MIFIKLNTHNRTPRPEKSKLTKWLLIICSALIFGIFGLISFATFYYARNAIGGALALLIPVVLATSIVLHIKDLEKAYIQIKGNDICVVDYYWGIKKEKHISFSDITSAEIHIGYSHQVKGYRFSTPGIKYIVFKKDNRYLFKIIALPETEEIFKQYME